MINFFKKIFIIPFLIIKIIINQILHKSFLSLLDAFYYIYISINLFKRIKKNTQNLSRISFIAISISLLSLYSFITIFHIRSISSSSSSTFISRNEREGEKKIHFKGRKRRSFVCVPITELELENKKKKKKKKGSVELSSILV